MNYRMSSVCFNVYLSFINSLDIVFKQMGTLLYNYLPLLTKVLVNGVLKLSKLYI